MLVVLFGEGSDLAYAEPNALTIAYGENLNWKMGIKRFSRSWEAGPLCPPAPLRVENGHYQEF